MNTASHVLCGQLCLFWWTFSMWLLILTAFIFLLQILHVTILARLASCTFLMCSAITATSLWQNGTNWSLFYIRRFRKQEKWTSCGNSCDDADVIWKWTFLDTSHKASEECGAMSACGGTFELEYFWPFHSDHKCNFLSNSNSESSASLEV